MGTRLLGLFSKHVEAHGGDDWVFSFVEEGHSMRKVAELTGCSSRGMLYNWIKNGGEARRAKLNAARKISAHCHAEDAGEVLDDLAQEGVISSADVSLASSRARYKQWLAGMRNREEYGEKAGVEINLSVGDLHLDALRRNSAGVVAPLPPSAPVLEAEVVEMLPPTVEAMPVEGATEALPDELRDLL